MNDARRFTPARINALLMEHVGCALGPKSDVPMSTPTRGAFGNGHRFDNHQPLPSKISRWAKEWQRQRKAARLARTEPGR